MTSKIQIPKSKFQNLKVSGFKFSAVSAGIKTPGRKDLCLISSEAVSNIAGVFTTNKIKAAPVKLDTSKIASGKGQAIIANSGNANACTGARGMKDAKETAASLAKELGISPMLVYVASTGVIGHPLPAGNIKTAIPGLVKKLSVHSLPDAADAIMTTDTFPKIVSRKININGKTGTIAGIAKGAGMISPNMATMLCFIVTDIAVEPNALNSALKNAVKTTFNMLTIDNDMSTNDTVLLMANGALKNSPLRKNSPSYRKFKNALTEVSYNLTKMIAMDGEGATKLIEVIVKGARTEADAEKVCRAIANSLLVKTAIYGQDPNWGRIMAAIGYSGADVQEEKISISLNGLKLVSRGKGRGNEASLRKTLSKNEIIITVDLSLGKKEARVLTCDLTEGYIKINASYTT
ncbi:MAG: bifunctional glutamate N-acetyltransferase/amino-acid acetyltransferase ArgJ [Nitrospirae bacterium]|nr:bifunctional glutamate N-acetyltransferase/amino-acid acetyltransferase ArgJ [Nitrospirota bacterium]